MKDSCMIKATRRARKVKQCRKSLEWNFLSPRLLFLKLEHSYMVISKVRPTNGALMSERYKLARQERAS